MLIILSIYFLTLITVLRFASFKSSVIQLLLQGLFVFLLVQASSFLKLDIEFVSAYSLAFSCLVILSRIDVNKKEKFNKISIQNILFILILFFIWYQYGFLYVAKLSFISIVFGGLLSFSQVGLITSPHKFKIEEKDYFKMLKILLNYCFFAFNISLIYLMVIFILKTFYNF